MKISQKTVSASFLATIVSIVTIANANAQYLVQVWQRVEFGTHIGSTNIWSIDLEGNGSEEIVVGGGGYENRHFSILEYVDVENDYVTMWTSRLFGASPIRLIEIANLDQDSDYEIYVILSNGQIEVYDGSTMSIIDTFTTQAINANSSSIADVDNDGEIEFTIVGNNYLQIYNGTTFVLEWDTTAYGGNDVEVGDVDGDENNEIVLAEGYVFDGVTHSIEWSYVGGFGIEIEIADIDQDSIPEIIGMNSWDYITAFDGRLHTPIWQIDTDDDHDALFVTDIEGDGDVEILMGNGQWGAINCYSATTRELLWYINNPEHGVTNISVGDPDGDGIKEVIWGAGQTSTGPDHLFIGSTDYHQIEWQSIDLDGPFSVDVFDVDDDGINEISGASRESNSGYDGGTVLIYDGLLHNLEWFSGELSYADIKCITVGNINRNDQGEIVVGVGNKIYVLDGISHQTIWQSPSLSTVNAIELADIDNDNVVEIVVGDNAGYITIYNGETFEEEWQSIDTGGSIGGITIANCDQDNALEIVFFADGGIIQIYDGETHFLEWQSVDISNVTALDVSDLDLDGDKEIALGHSNGDLTIIDCNTHSVVDQISVETESIAGLIVANLDSIPGKEILLGTSTLKIIDAVDYSTIWESEPFGSNIGDYGSLLVMDIDNNQFMDVFFGSSWGIFQFECSTPYPDITPPTVVSISPPDGLQFVGIDTDIKATFSEAIAEESLNSETMIITTENDDTVSATITYDEATLMVICTPDDYLPENSLITVTLTGDISDTSGNGLDGNANGISEGSPLDDFVWSFTTGAWIDTVGPSITNAMVEPDSVWTGLDVTVCATASDSSGIAISAVAYVECFLDSLGDFGNGIPLEPVDGEFDSVVEDVILTLDTDDWSGGNRTLFIHGKDTNDNWGEFAELPVYIISEMASNWPMFGQNAQHTGFNESDSIDVPLELKWSENYTSGSLNPVTVANNLIFLTERVRFDDAIIRCIDAEDGSVMWSFSFGQIYSINPPSFAYGYVFVQTCDHSENSFLTAFDALTGDQIWQSPFSCQWERYLSPTIYNGKVFINGGYYGGMYAFDAFDGEQLWFKGLNQYDEWTPAVYDDIAYAFVGDQHAGGQSQLVAVDVYTGNTIWEKNDIEFNWHGWSMGTAPVIDGNANIMLVTSHDYLHAVDISSHDVLWYKSGIFDITPAVCKGQVFAINSKTLVVYDEFTGDELWTFNGDGNISYPPVISNGYVFVSSDQNTYTVNIETHQADWSCNVGGHLIVANNHLYIATSGGNVYAFTERPTSIADENDCNIPKFYTLHQNYPNPFNRSTTINYQLPVSGYVFLKIYNIMGQWVVTLVDAFQEAGNYSKVWEAEGLSSGVYFYRITTRNYTDVRRCIILK